MLSEPISVLIDAAQRTITGQNYFSLLALLMDRSYEEGTRNSEFIQSVATFEQVGIFTARLTEHAW